jgi:aminopeptidase N
LTTLTRDEAVARAALLSVERYDIELDLTGLAAGDELRARTTVRFTCTDEGAASFVDAVASVTAATLNDRPLDVSGHADGRLPLPGLAADNVLVVESLQVRTGDRAGVHRSVDPSDGLVYVWTSFEPDEARRVFACFDQPDLKAVFGFTVTAPADWTVVSGSPAAAVSDGDGGARVWTFEDTPPLSSYVPVVNAGPFHELRREIGGHDLGLFARRSLAAYLERDADELFDVTAAGLAFFGERFAMPFPQRKYDQVFVPDMGGAMENYGCVTWSDVFVYRSDPSRAERELRALILLHEMAHMWFGDIVTMRWWDDLWLNEAFADWAACWAAVAATEHVDAWASWLATRKEAGYAADRAPTTHPIRQAVPDVEAAAASFDMVTYAKGASVLKQLVAHVGEDAFVAGLRGYFAAHAWGNATLDDLIGEISRASGRDLRDWTSEWLDTAGTNVLELVTEVADGRYTDVRVLQRAPERFPVLRTHTVALGSYAGSPGSALTRRSAVAVEVSGPETVVAELVGADADGLLLLNDDDLTFADVRVSGSALPALIEGAAQLPTPMSRVLAVSVVRNLVMAGEQPAAAFVDCASRVLRVETADAVVEQLLGAAIRSAEMWSPDDDREPLLHELADACVALAESDGDPARRLAALRGLTRTATTDEHIALLRSAADDVDLRWRTLARLAALDRLDDAGVAAALEADTDPDAWVRALTVRAATPAAEAKEEVWRAVADERRVPLGSLYEVGRAFWDRGHEKLLSPYAERYPDLLTQLSDDGMIGAYGVAAVLFPIVGVDESFADRIVEVAAAGTVPPVVRRTVGERADELRRMLRARDLGAAWVGSRA